MSRRIIFLLISLVLSRANTQEYIWPTDASRAMTSSFAESRPGRFHAGLDIKTWGREGYQVFAVRPGYISRIRVSPYGYGRALYLTLDTGETIVYAHLQRFNEELENYVWRQQQKRGLFEIQLYPPPSLFRYGQGDLLAFTGQTGVGFPHLHFEMRDPAGRPMNPFLKGYRVNDSVRPTVSKVSFIPLDALSTVNQDWQPVVQVPLYRGAGKYQVPNPIMVTGRIAIGVSAYDRMNEITNKFGSYINRLYVDERLVFESRYDNFGYNVNTHAVLDRDFRFLVQGKGYFYNLFRDEGNRLPFYNKSQFFAGVLDFGDLYPSTPNSAFSQPVGLTTGDSVFTTLGNGRHTFRIEVADYWGNSAIVSGTLVRDEKLADSFIVPSWEDPLAYNDDLRQLEIKPEFYDRYIRLKFWLPGSSTSLPPVFGITGAGNKEPLRMLRKSAGRFVSAWPLNSADIAPLTLEIGGNPDTRVRRWIFYKPVARGDRKSIYSQDGLCRIDFSRNSLFKDIYVRTFSQEPDTTSGYQFASKLYTVEPIDVALDNGANITLKFAEKQISPQQLAIYYRNGRNGWIFLGNNGNRGGMSGHVSSFGTYAILRDDVRPKIDFLYPSENARLTTNFPELKAAFKDNLSGIKGEQNMKMLIDGQKVIAEYDPEQKTLTHKPRTPLSQGRHVVSLTVIDRCGNSRSAEHSFWIE